MTQPKERYPMTTMYGSVGLDYGINHRFAFWGVACKLYNIAASSA